MQINYSFKSAVELLTFQHFLPCLESYNKAEIIKFLIKKS